MNKLIDFIKQIKKHIDHYNDGILGYKNAINKYGNTNLKRRIYLVGTATNGNLGDQAISYNQLLFLSEIEDKEIIEITIDEYWKMRKYLKKHIKSYDIICIQGGGNMGIEYWAAEESRRDLIKIFPRNKIIIFPQTIDYGKSKKGIKEEYKSSKIYNKHNNLHIFAREKYSYEIMKKLYYKNNVYLVPDIVLKYKLEGNFKKRDGALLCLRNDCESILNNKDKHRIVNILEDNKIKFNLTDTCIDKMVNRDYRSLELNKKFNEIGRANLIITDRLHGMVFAALTGTPCIVFSNYNKKVCGVYEWINNLPYIKFVDNINEIELAIKELSGMNGNNYNTTILNEKFEVLYNVFE